MSPWFFVTVLVLVVSDLATKAWAFDFLDRFGEANEYGVLEYSFVHPWFRFARLENSGTVWGLFQNGTSVLIGLRIVMVFVLAYVASRISTRERFKLLGLGLVLGGALGNLYDNLFQANRSVRDFLDVHIPLPWSDSLYHWPTFNIADAAIVMGAISLFFAFGREDKPDAKPAANEARS